MGASQFQTIARGKSAEEAFHKAVSDARHWHGHSGYTGTIAEKESFVIVEKPEEMEVTQFCRLIETGGTEYDKEFLVWRHYGGPGTEQIFAALEQTRDKWGPAGCVDLGNNEYLFFGWASS